MRLTILLGPALAAGLAGLMSAGVYFSPEFFGVSGCPILALLQPVRVTLADDTDFVEMEKQPDLGTYPSFRLRVHGNGQVDWEGRQCVAARGRREGRLNPQAAKALIERFEAEGFCQLCSHYYPYNTHADTTRLTLSLGDERTDVVEQLRQPPGNFGELEQEVERTEPIAGWIGGRQGGDCWAER